MRKFLISYISLDKNDPQTIELSLDDNQKANIHTFNKQLKVLDKSFMWILSWSLIEE